MALHLLMDRAYEDDETRQLALDLGFIPVVPPLSTRVQPWEYDRAKYKRRDESNGCSAASRASAASSRASTNSTACSSASSASR
jgi:hypothetical protein